MTQAQAGEAAKKLNYFWGYKSFRPGQEEAIQAALNGKNTIILFPTGGGKSLCYQVPAVIMEGITLVISPLIALMQDQVQQLDERDIPATFINSTISSWEVEQRLVNARNGMYKLLYCAPERLETDLWKAELPNLNISLVAIDEAHCISEWGHDFRPDYRQIRPALASLDESVPWMALTATATPEVREDIIRNLQFPDPVIIAKGFERDNLKWWTIEGPKKDRNLLKSVRKAAPLGSGIIYGGTRKNCERLARLVENKLNIKSAAYHAGVAAAKRKTIQQQWINGETSLVVATSAFGMGIDKADCRYVIHYQLPYTLEAYYQQAGRAGRDGVESYPLLLFKPSDAHLAERRIKESYPDKNQLQKVYDTVCDTLNLAIGSEEEEMQEIAISALKKRTRLSPNIVQAALKTLKHLGIIEMTNYVFPQIGVQFTVNLDYLRDQIKKEKNHQKAAFIDGLFRQFGGEAFSNIKYLAPDYIERKLDITENGLIKGLQVLQNHDHILQFKMRGERPLVRPVEARMHHLPFNTKQLEMHRNSLLEKLSQMIGYIETEQCREVYIRTYFGEQNVAPCGHCDNCLSPKNNTFKTPSARDIDALKELLNKDEMNLDEIKNRLQWHHRRIERSLSYLLRENKVAEVGEKYCWQN